MIKLVKIVKSPNPLKKYRAYFSDGDHTDFGASGYEDFTTHGDVERRDRYRLRHAKDLKTKDFKKPGYLSYFILWNKPSFDASVADYKNRFNL